MILIYHKKASNGFFCDMRQNYQSANYKPISFMFNVQLVLRVVASLLRIIIKKLYHEET